MKRLKATCYEVARLRQNMVLIFGQHHRSVVKIDMSKRSDILKARNSERHVLPRGNVMDPFIDRLVRQVQEHAPGCLSGFRASPSGAESWNDWANWSLACACGATQGKVLGHSLQDCNPTYNGPPLFVSPLAFECSACGQTTEIIDTKAHGYNSEIDKLEGGSGGDSNYRGSGERQSIPCPECGANEFSVTARCLHTHFDLIDDEPELEPRAQEFFDGFDCVGKCVECGAESSLANFELA